MVPGMRALLQRLQIHLGEVFRPIRDVNRAVVGPTSPIRLLIIQRRTESCTSGSLVSRPTGVADGLSGPSAPLRQLWGVWESLPLLQGPRQRSPRNKAQNQTHLKGWETLKEDARCFLKEEGLPFPQTGPEWRLVYRAMGKVLAARAFLTDTPAEVMQLPVQDVADSKEQMILRAVCDERILVPVESPRPSWTALEAREPWRR